MTTREEIKSWIDGRPEDCTHMLVVCDTFDYEDYPVYYPYEYEFNIYMGVKVPLTLDEVQEKFSKNMQKIMECYSFTGKYTIEEQLKEHRAFHYD